MLDQGGVERLPLVLGIVPLGALRCDVERLQREDLQPLALEPVQDLPDESALHAVRLHEDQGPLEAAFRHRSVEPLGQVRVSRREQSV